MEQPSEIRICPVCNSAVFSDVDTCFKCMHKLTAEEIGGAYGTARTSPASQHCDCKMLWELIVEFERFLSDFIASRESEVEA